MRRNEAPYPILMKFWKVVGIPDVIICANLGDDQLMGLEVAVVKFWHSLSAFVVVVNAAGRYKLLSLTYKVLATNQPPYLHHLISVQPPRSTRSSSLVTLARPPTSSSLRITDRSFRYASPCLRESTS